MKRTNCINCGALLHGDVCEYCGTDYRSQDEEKILNEIDDILKDDEVEEVSDVPYIELEVYGERGKYYIGDIETNRIYNADLCRDERGHLKSSKIVTKKKITLIEI